VREGARNAPSREPKRAAVSGRRSGECGTNELTRMTVEVADDVGVLQENWL